MEPPICLLYRKGWHFFRRRHGSGAALAVAAILLWIGGIGEAAETTDAAEPFRLGPGDHISIHVFGEDDLSMDVELNNTGTLNYPYLGELKVEGLTVSGLEQLITQGLKGPYLVDPDVTVSMIEYRPFYLYGEVLKPGGFPYQPGLTLQKAIALGGGFTERASRKKITVTRAGDPDAGDKPIEMDDPVYPGDVISVPESFF